MLQKSIRKVRQIYEKVFFSLNPSEFLQITAFGDNIVTFKIKQQMK